FVMRIGIRQRESMQVEPGPEFREAVEQFLTEQAGRWAARRDVVNRAIFGAIQVLEVVATPAQRVELEASFDEYNLDLRIRHDGTPLVIPDSAPDLAEVRESEEGERLLAGYLLRRSADRVSSRAINGRAEILLHYDH